MIRKKPCYKRDLSCIYRDFLSVLDLVLNKNLPSLNGWFFQQHFHYVQNALSQNRALETRSLRIRSSNEIFVHEVFILFQGCIFHNVKVCHNITAGFIIVKRRTVCPLSRKDGGGNIILESSKVALSLTTQSLFHIPPHSRSTRVTSRTTGSSRGITDSNKPSFSILHGFRWTYVLGKIPLTARFLIEKPLYQPTNHRSILTFRTSLVNDTRNHAFANDSCHFTCAFLQNLHRFSNFQGETISRVSPPIVNGCGKDKIVLD